jgi:oxygen-dependent protoporphyrinogen oxidase
MARTLAVIGGGIAGLTTALGLMDRGAEVVCLAAAPRAGGHVRTERVDGFTCEWGANGFLDSAPATLALVAGLHLEDRLQPADAAAQRRYVYRHGRLHEAPLGPGALVRSGLLTWGEKLRLAAEVLQPRRRGETDESVLAFVPQDWPRCRLGPGGRHGRRRYAATPAGFPARHLSQDGGWSARTAA